jgi:hypothetical protein
MELPLASAKPYPLKPGACAPLLFSPLKPFPPRRPAAARLLLRLLASASGAAGEEVFGARKELTGVQPLVEALPPAARTAVELAVAAAAVAAGYGIGLRVGGGSRAAAVAGAAVLGVASVAGAAAVNSVVPEVAAVGLHNYVAGHDDPTQLESGEVESIANK